MLSKFIREERWIEQRLGSLAIVASLFLIILQLLSMQSSISDPKADFSAFSVDVRHKFADLDDRLTILETAVSTLIIGQQKIVSTPERMEQQLNALSQR